MQEKKSTLLEKRKHRMAEIDGYVWRTSDRRNASAK